jgi:hypothetical protein
MVLAISILALAIRSAEIELLKYESELGAANCSAFRIVHSGNVFTIDQYLSACSPRHRAQQVHEQDCHIRKAP